MSLPTDAKARKRIPVFSGVLGYFPDAIVEVAKISFEGNEQHNPGQPLHWARDKSTDHEDCIIRHGLDAFKARDQAEKVKHMAQRAWRSLAALQLAVEALESLSEPEFSDGPEFEGFATRVYDDGAIFGEGGPLNGHDPATCLLCRAMVKGQREA
jgi:hypothetical protein